MYDWKTLRLLAVILLCLPLAHISYVVARGLYDYLDPSPEVWDIEMASIIERDMGLALPENPVVVIGGQRARLWKDLPVYLQPRSTLLRPLGDATLEDLIHQFDRLAAFYQPAELVIVPSYADLHLRDDKTADDYSRALSQLLSLDESYKSTDWRYVITPIQMPLHPEDRERIDDMAEAGAKLAQKHRRLTVINPNPLLSGSDGRPNPAFFRAGGVNLNSTGYARLTLLLETAMLDRERAGVERSRSRTSGTLDAFQG